MGLGMGTGTDTGTGTGTGTGMCIGMTWALSHSTCTLRVHAYT